MFEKPNDGKYTDYQKKRALSLGLSEDSTWEQIEEASEKEWEETLRQKFIKENNLPPDTSLEECTKIGHENLRRKIIAQLELPQETSYEVSLHELNKYAHFSGLSEKVAEIIGDIDMPDEVTLNELQRAGINILLSHIKEGVLVESRSSVTNIEEIRAHLRELTMRLVHSMGLREAMSVLVETDNYLTQNGLIDEKTSIKLQDIAMHSRSLLSSMAEL